MDDEEPARAVLKEMLGRMPGVRVLGEAGDGLEAVRAAAKLKPDCVFLDIRMPRLDGFEAMELLDPSVAVVFVTAYDSYAVKAFEVNAVDYVLKPFSEARLAEALERARTRARERVRPEPGALAAAALPPGEFLSRIVLRDGPNVRVLPVEKLDFAEAQDDFLAVKAEGKKHVKSQTLSSLAASLDPSRFVRVHRSYIVNLDRLQRIELYAKNSHVAILTDGTRVPVSREGHARLRAILDGSPLRERGGPK